LRLPSARHYLAMLVGGLLFAVHWMTYFHAMQVSTVAVGVVALLTFPVITAMIEPPLLARRAPDRPALIAGLGVLAGVTLIGLEGGLGGNVPLGLSVGVFSATLYSLRNLLQKRFLQGVSGPQVMLYQGTLTALLFAPFLSVSPGELTLGTWGLLLLLGTVFTAVPHTLITHALRRVSATGVSFVLALQVPYATLLAALVLSEIPGPLAILGGALVVGAALYVTTWQRRAALAAAGSG
jgi:drug/metabolite transporter (DMT)-like permease